MKLWNSFRPSFRTLTMSGSRLSLTVIITLIVLSSTMLIYENPIVVSARSNSVDTSSQHSGFSLGDNSVQQMSPTNASPLDSGFTTQGALGSLTARPTNNIVNTNSFYDVVFLTPSNGIIKFIQVTFPAGTTVPTSANFNEAEGIGPGFISDVTGQTITYTVNNAVNVPAGTKIRLEFANINNPLNPSASYKVTVTTRNPSNVIIDGPTQSTTYTIKQIGKNAIAKGAIIPDIIDRTGTFKSVPPLELENAFVLCPETHPHAMGGGIETQPGAESFLNLSDSFGVSSNAWSANMYNTDPAAAHSFAATVRCMADMP